MFRVLKMPKKFKLKPEICENSICTGDFEMKDPLPPLGIYIIMTLFVSENVNQNSFQRSPV